MCLEKEVGYNIVAENNFQKHEKERQSRNDQGQHFAKRIRQPDVFREGFADENEALVTNGNRNETLEEEQQNWNIPSQCSVPKFKPNSDIVPLLHQVLAVQN